MRKIFLALPFVLLSGCSFFETIIEALGGTAEEISRQPKIYVAQTVATRTGDRNRIVEIAAFDSRDGRNPGVRYEAAVESMTLLTRGSNARGFQGMHLRPDNRFLGTIAVAELAGSSSLFAVLRDNETNALTLEASDDDMRRLALTGCDIAARYRDDLMSFLDAARIDLPASASIRWIAADLPVGLPTTSAQFERWTASGRAVIAAEVIFEVVVTVSGEEIIGPSTAAQGRRFYSAARFYDLVFDPANGRLVGCDLDEPAAERRPRRTDMWPNTRGADSEFSAGPPGERRPVYTYPTTADTPPTFFELGGNYSGFAADFR